MSAAAATVKSQKKRRTCMCAPVNAEPKFLDAGEHTLELGLTVAPYSCALIQRHGLREHACLTLSTCSCVSIHAPNSAQSLARLLRQMCTSQQLLAPTAPVSMCTFDFFRPCFRSVVARNGDTAFNYTHGACGHVCQTVL